MNCPELYLSALLALPQWWGDRDHTPEVRRELYRPVAATICRIGETPRERDYLAAQVYSETRISECSLRHEKGCRDGGRSIGPFQVVRDCAVAWDESAPLEARLDAAATYTLAAARLGWARCGSDEGAFVHQVRRGCHGIGNWAKRRVRLMSWIGVLVGRALRASGGAAAEE